MSIIALWVLVLFETGLLLLLLRTLGKLREQTGSFDDRAPSERFEIGERAPSFVATDQHGKKIKLEDSRGKRRILAFMSPGCPPCDDAMQTLNTALQEEQNLVVLAFGGTDAERNIAYALEHDAQMPFLTPDSDILEKKYGISAKPFAIAVDETGIIRAKGGVNDRFLLHRLMESAFEPTPVPR